MQGVRQPWPPLAWDAVPLYSPSTWTQWLICLAHLPWVVWEKGTWDLSHARSENFGNGGAPFTLNGSYTLLCKIVHGLISA